MKQFTIVETSNFAIDIKAIMAGMNLKKKSDAVRIAVSELAKKIGKKNKTDFHSWIGAGLKAPTNPNPKFKSNDELW